MQSRGYSCLRFVRVEAQRLPNAHFECSRTKPATLTGLQLAHAVEHHGQHRRRGFFDQQSDSWPEGCQTAIRRTRSLRKYDDVVATVQRLSGMGKAALKVAQAR